jgi:hypothetical protein
VALRVCVDRVAQPGISTLPTYTCGGPGWKEKGGGVNNRSRSGAPMRSGGPIRTCFSRRAAGTTGYTAQWDGVTAEWDAEAE